MKGDGSMPYNVPPELKNKTWLMYLRKSRQDDPNETVEEVLAKHESILQEWARRELGHEIPEDCIYREVISGGESIDERVKLCQVLSRIEDSDVVGAVVKDPQRWTRGSLEDCGRLISLFKYTSTLVATPMMVYDMSNKMECKFFESELMRGRDYLDYVCDILSMGRTTSVKKGNFISSKAAFGYDKITIGKDHTLIPNKDADTVRMIFDLYVNEGIGYHQIAGRLDEMGIKPDQADYWNPRTIGRMLRNVQYDGKVCYGRKKTVTVIKNGVKKASRPLAPDDEVLIVEGKHQAIVDHDLFMAAQEIINNHPRVKADRQLRSPVAGLVRCAKCGKALFYQAYSGNRKPRVECRSKPPHFKSAIYEEVENALILSLEQSELPNLEALQRNNAGNSIAIQQKMIKRLEEEMKGYHEQEEMQYEMLETKRYTLELFEQRNAALRKKMGECEERLKKARQALPNAVNYEEKIIQLKDAIQALKDKGLAPEEKNCRLKSIVDRIELATEDKGRGETDIHMKVFLKI